MVINHITLGVKMKLPLYKSILGTCLIFFYFLPKLLRAADHESHVRYNASVIYEEQIHIGLNKKSSQFGPFTYISR